MASPERATAASRPMYLSGVSTARLRGDLAHAHGIGLMVQPGNGLAAQLPDYPAWAADNGCFAAGASFQLDGFLRWLDKLAPSAGTCRFAVAPDVVGDAGATWTRSRAVLPELRALGYPAALVAQNGLAIDHATGELAIYTDDRGGSDTGVRIPWDAFDVLFIGGDDGYKIGTGIVLRASTWWVVAHAQRQGKPVHMGRVNSRRRYDLAAAAGLDSVDGTFLAYGPERNLDELLSWLDAALPQAAAAPSRPRESHQLALFPCGG